MTETNSLSANVNTWIDKYVSALTGGVTTWATLGLELKNDTFTYSVFYDALAHTGQNFLRVTPSGSNGGITSIQESQARSRWPDSRCSVPSVPRAARR